MIILHHLICDSFAAEFVMEIILKEKLALARYNLQYQTEYTFLKPKQTDCLRHIFKRDTLAILPTGYGKSLIFELLPLYAECVKQVTCLVIIIAPLNAIIQQEIKKLGKYAAPVLKAESLKSSATFYIGHPEDVIFHAQNLAILAKNYDNIFIVVDEAHCVLDWGDDFRPDFRSISDLRSHMPASLKMLAVTATASKASQKQIAKHLGMKDYFSVNTAPVMNHNIYLSVAPRIPSTGGRNTVQESFNFVFKPLLLELYSDVRKFPLTIIYCKLQWCGYGIELAQRLLGPVYQSTDMLPCVVQFHAQQPVQMNSRIIDSLSHEGSSVKLVFATIALGMGCDLQHVRRIIHAGAPSCLEVYTQEVGRAGRDGHTSDAILYCNGTDLVQRHIDSAMKDYCKEKTMCRRKVISKYFDSILAMPSSVCCDFCDPQKNTTVVTSIDIHVPSLVQRQEMHDILASYASSDNTGLCQEALNSHVIHLIMDTFEYVDNVNQIMKCYRQCKAVAESIYSIRCHVLS